MTAVNPSVLPTPTPNRDTVDATLNPDPEINMLGLLNAVLRHLRAIFLTGLAFFAIALSLGLTEHRTYTADVSFVPQLARPNAGVSALASQFGLGSLTTADVGNSPPFYVDLVKSREILRKVVRHEYTVHDKSGAVLTGDLIKLYGLHAKTPALLEAVAMKQVRESLNAAASIKTGVITVSATAEYPDLAAQIVERVFAEVNAFNLEGRQLRASVERKFAEQARADAQTALTAAENRLEEFLQANRVLLSPSLTLQHERLQRDVSTRQQLYTSLAQMYEQARLEEVRDTPALTLIEPAVVPLEANARGAVKRAIQSFIFGITIAVLLFLGVEYAMYPMGERSPAYEEFAALRNELLRKLRHPFRSSAKAAS
jgi:uncharacterized protein involved in exopolysaccharide biosynthesis